MIMYHAGNFPQMKNPEEERKMMKIVLKRGYKSYNRLLSFFYKEDAITVMEALHERESSEEDQSTL